MKAYFYKITVYFSDKRPVTVIRHFYTDNKQRVEKRLWLTCKLRLKERFAGIDLWIVPEDREEVIKYKKENEL